MNSTVGLAMIVRDGASTLDVCFRSIDGLFDQIVVVDTGSTDNSKEIAKSYGAEVYDFVWCDDFSAARNFSFSKLKTDWAFWLDSDDCLLGREFFDEMVSKCEEKGLHGVILEYMYSFDPEGVRLLEGIEPSILNKQIPSMQAYDLLKVRCNTTQFRERLVRLIPGWNWLYPVHEALPVPGHPMGRFEKVKIIHRRHKTSRPAKSGRNLEILEKVPVHLRDERIWFYFGLEYASHMRVDDSIEAFRKYLPLSTVEDEKYLALHYLADLYRNKNEIDLAMEYDLKALSMRPTWRDAYAGLLASSVVKGDWKAGLYYGAKAKLAEPPDTPFAFNPVHQAVGWVGDYVNCLLNFGLLEEALGECKEALKIVPENSDFKRIIDDISVRMNQDAGKIAVANAMEFFLRHDDAETVAVIASRLPKEFLGDQNIRRLVDPVNQLCSSANLGVIPPVPLKFAPGTVMLDPYDFPANYDVRFKYLIDRVALYPKTKSILVVGGPNEIVESFARIGLAVSRVDRVFNRSGAKFDCIVLWNCLEVIKFPDVFVSDVKEMVSPGGVLFVIVGNGPSTRGLAPTSEITPRLRSFTIDTLRRLVGTTRMPVLTPAWEAEAGDMILEIPKGLESVPPRKIAIVAAGAPEAWGPWSLDRGIGGSEEAVIRLSRAFLRRGHSVSVYGSRWEGFDGIQPRWEGELVTDERVAYKDVRDYEAVDILIGWRHPELFTHQVRPFEATWKALWLHDSTERDRVALASNFVDRIYCISDFHATKYDGIPKIYRGRNGIDVHEIPSNVFRNPHKAVFISTPFRGLEHVLSMWPYIRSKVSDAELHAYYGWEAADRMGATSTPHGKAFKERIIQMCQQPGIIWHGRIGQPELYHEVSSAGVWSYSSTWAEEHCVSALIAQACGAWPVVTSLGALPQTVVWGWKVDMPQFADAVVEAMFTAVGREKMMAWGRGEHNSWDEVAKCWELLWNGMEA